MEDRIDFPVSDTFRNYFYEQGITTYPSPGYISGRDQAFISAMEAIVSALRDLQEERVGSPFPSPPARARPPAPPPASPPPGRRVVPL
jgi:hypothetical protein